jgi:cytochrome b561
MTLKNSSDRYSPGGIALHWLTLLLLVLVYLSIELHDAAPKGSALRANLKSLHFSLGLCVLALVLIRLGVRWGAGRAPAIVPPMPAWQNALAQLMHVVLYAFVVAMPLIGWLAQSASGNPVTVFGWAAPALIGADKAVYRQIKEVHEALATVGYGLVGLHAAAALWHHHFQHDDTLLRMLPGRRR